MPTLQQLMDSWDFERITGISAAHGFESEHPDHIPSPLSLQPFTGEIVGTIQYDEENDDLKIIPLSAQKPKGP
ncbi:MAG: hypothetical protein JWM96_386 [Alphaproteobacteria bacterium]|nr:hypothetical protein [Alphaproteobacteria bacterium]